LGFSTIDVPDPGSRDRDVVLVSRGCWGNPKGVGNLEQGGDGEGMRKGEVGLRATWDQGGQGCITPKEGFQVNKGEQREVDRDWQGEQKQGIAL
jgi:hypothetical protein